MNDEKKLPAPLPGNRINNVGAAFPVVDHKGHKADTNSIARSKKPKLRRKHAQQLINVGKGTPELIRMATRPTKKS